MTMFDRLVERLDTGIGAWNHHCAFLQSWGAGTFRRLELFDMPFIWNADEVGYLCKLRALLCDKEEVSKIATTELCCF